MPRQTFAKIRNALGIWERPNLPVFERYKWRVTPEIEYSSLDGVPL
jgi:hypothetical protein